MINYGSLRAWIVDSLAVVPDLEVHDRLPASIVTPCAYPQRIVVDTRTAVGGEERATVEIAVVVSRSDEESAWELIDTYVTRGVTGCVVSALEDATPDGFDSVAVTGWELDPVVVVNEVSYLAVVVTCEVIG